MLTLTYAGESIVCGWFNYGWLRITIQIKSCDSSICSSMFLRRRRSITSRCWLIVRTSTVGRRWRAECRLGAVLLVGTRRTQAAYHWVTTVRLCPALYVHEMVLQERDGYNMAQNEHWQALEPAITTPEEPMDELFYVPPLYQNARAVSI
jgi:hypothetical protein